MLQIFKDNLILNVFVLKLNSYIFKLLKTELLKTYTILLCWKACLIWNLRISTFLLKSLLGGLIIGDDVLEYERVVILTLDSAETCKYRWAKMSTTVCIKNIIKGRGVISVSLNECPVSSDVASCTFVFQQYPPSPTITYPRPALSLCTEILAHLYLAEAPTLKVPNGQ